MIKVTSFLLGLFQETPYITSKM